MTRTLLSAIALLCFALSSVAQAKIDKIIEDMEKRHDVETTYTERRAPRKKKLVRISRIMKFNDNKYYKQLVKAFEDERDNSVSAAKTNEMMTYRFENSKGSSSYTLSWNPGYASPYTLVMSWKSAEASDQSYIGEDANSSHSVTVYNVHSSKSGKSSSKSVSYSTPCNDSQKAEVRRQAAEARRQAAEARKQAAEARRQAADARRQAADARRQAAQARRHAKEKNNHNMNFYTARAVENAHRAKCRTINPNGEVKEFSAFDAIDNSTIWEHLANTDPASDCSIAIIDNSGKTTIIEMGSPVI